MPGWADDPELLATFRAEVEERVASLQAGLLALEAHPSPRQVVVSLFRDAHTDQGLGPDARADRGARGRAQRGGSARCASRRPARRYAAT